MHIHVFGGSGSGTSTLGRASPLEAPFFDADDFYWPRTEPPYQTPRSPAERRAALVAAVDGLPSWILSGSMMGWGDVLIPALELAVYVSTPPVLRIARLRAREEARFGARLAPGGDMHAEHLEFMAWAARYEGGGLDVRSRASHARWTELLGCPVLRIEGDVTTEERVRWVMEAAAQLRGRPDRADELGPRRSAWPRWPFE